MIEKLKGILKFLRRNIWTLAAFLVPFTIRSIPEILSWPYILGYDTLTVVKYIQSGIVLSTPDVFIHSQMFYSLATVLDWLTGNTIFVLKVCGPMLIALVSTAMFFYAKRVLCWNGLKSFLVGLFVSIYFVSLRNSWDLFAQSFGLVFMLCTLIILRSYNSRCRFPFMFVFMFLTVLSHQLISVLMFFILGLEAIRLLLNRRRLDFFFIFVSLALMGGLFLFRTYSPQIDAVVIPAASVTSTPTLQLVFLVGGLLIYCYFLIFPLATWGFLKQKDWLLRYWIIWCLSVPLLLAFFPNLPLYYWNRWVYLLVYPLLFFTVEGLNRLWDFGSNHKIKIRRIFPKVLALTYIALLITLSGFYIAANPRAQIPIFSTANPYLSFIPSSMMQNTLPNAAVTTSYRLASA